MFDTIMAFNCINFAYVNECKKSIFINKLNNFSEIGSKFIVRYMDYDLFIKKYNDKIKLNTNTNTNIIIKNANNPSFINIDCKNHFQTSYILLGFIKRLSSKITSTFRNWLESNNWKSIDYEFNKNYYDLNKKSSLWDIYFSCFSVQVFSKFNSYLDIILVNLTIHSFSP